MVPIPNSARFFPILFIFQMFLNTGLNVLVSLSTSLNEQLKWFACWLKTERFPRIIMERSVCHKTLIRYWGLFINNSSSPGFLMIHSGSLFLFLFCCFRRPRPALRVGVARWPTPLSLFGVVGFWDAKVGAASLGVCAWLIRFSFLLFFFIGRHFPRFRIESAATALHPPPPKRKTALPCFTEFLPVLVILVRTRVIAESYRFILAWFRYCVYRVFSETLRRVYQSALSCYRVFFLFQKRFSLRTDWNRFSHVPAT